ncbi:hypothetical protein [Clostridium sp. DL-VIII]|uniref:hypothetical protein n=1 Tax=Clostridium sp. DL-VIII TaxID=641107 RepID=UPI00163F4CA3|nr:hypothetical protein [Clostridium sp. DL-VIII]
MNLVQDFGKISECIYGKQCEQHIHIVKHLKEMIRVFDMLKYDRHNINILKDL